MDNAACSKGHSVASKLKKKPVKDELDRLKQAEKKRRRLEKALATSAAIISELEKKKQKKKEEQQRLDEEGAAIAEAVALQVLLGENADDACEVVVHRDRCIPFGSNGDTDMNLIVASGSSCFPILDAGVFSGTGMMGWLSEAYPSNWRWGRSQNVEWGYSSEAMEKGVPSPLYAQAAGWEGVGISVELVAAQAVSGLQIEDNADDQVVHDRVLRRKP